MKLPPDEQKFAQSLVGKLATVLGDNLSSLVIYGSAVRGNFVAGKSDLNLFLVLKESTPEAHTAIADQITGPVRVEPLIAAAGSLDRTMKSFPSKFLSIQRHYEVLQGEDPFRSMGKGIQLDRILVEESLRNVRLRVVYNYVKLKNEPKRYQAYLLDILPSFFTIISDVLRASNQQVPVSFEDRLPLFEKAFAAKVQVLSRLLELRAQPRSLKAGESLELHAGLCRLFDEILNWVEQKWPIP